MKVLKKYISIMLSVLLIMSPLNVLTANADSSFDASITEGSRTINYPELSVAVMPYYWTEGSKLTLLRDVEVTESIVVPSGTHTLDLNGFGIRAAGSRDFSVITIPSGSELILNDSGNSEHKYTLDENSLASVDDSAEGEYSTFSGGYITGASGESLNGGGISNSGTLTMNGGTIIGNSTGNKGGGISNSGTASINGGQIIYNRAIGWGGGIYLSDTVTNTVNLSGGVITHNGAGNGGGVHISNNGTLNLSDSPSVNDNYSINENPEYELNNVNITTGGVMCVTGALERGVSIGVRSSNGEDVITSSANTDYNNASKFTSDNDEYVVGKDSQSGQLKLHTPYTITWLNDNDEVLETDTDVAEGTVPTYNGETPVKSVDPQGLYTFDDWTPEVVAATESTSYTATYKTVTPVAKIGEVFFGKIENAVTADNWNEGSTLTLLADINTSATISVPEGAHTLDLNGFGLRAGESDYSVITVPANAELTLNDSGNTEHKYTVDENGLATVNDSAEEDYSTFTGGYITGASGDSLNGGAIKNSGTLTMNRATIIGNSANKGGGISNTGTANINGGQIIYNLASGWGGGIYLSDTAVNTVNLNGGSIAYNKAGNGGGIHVSENNSVNISGAPTVLNNVSTGNNPNNLNLSGNSFINVTGELGSNASIGIKRSNGTGVVTNSENTDYNVADRFVSDNPDYTVGKDVQSNQLIIHSPYTIEWINYDDTVLETDTDVAEGTIPTYDGALPVKPGTSEEAYAFDGWTPEVTAADGAAIYRAKFKTVDAVARINNILYATIEEAVKAENWTVDSTLTLLSDISTNTTITVPEGAHTLDLNGFGLRASAPNYSIITVPSDAALTLNDSGDTQHKYTVDENGFAAVNDNLEGEYSVFTGGYITGASGSSLVGGAIKNSGTLTVNGAVIIGNSAYKGGGIANSGTANINGGQIIYNYANGWGGGIYLSDTVSNTVNLSGGSITNNKAGNGGGIHVSANDRVNVSGSQTVINNVSVGNNPNNINLSSNGVIGITGELTGEAQIGVKRSDGAGIMTDSENTAYNNAERFLSDDPNYYIGTDSETSQLKLYAPYTVIWKNYDEAVLETDTNIAEGTIPTYDGETPVKPDDEEYTYTFEGWTPEVVAATADAVYTATFTAVPKPKAYTVTWKNYDETVLETDEEVVEGTVPTYDGVTPTKPDDEQYTYTFDKWSPEISEVSGDITYTATFSATRFIAKVGDKRFTSFSEAVTESEKTKGGAVITLLADADAPCSMNSLTYDVLRVKHDGNSADITDYKKNETNKGVTYYFRTEDKVYVDGTGDDDGFVEIAAAAAATVIVVGTGVEVVLGAGASVVVEGAAASSVSVDVSDSESECLEEEELEDGSKKYTNHKFHWVTIDTGISILDAGSEVLPDCVNDIWATYNQNVATIVKILPPVLTVIGYTDIILKFPYPEGWFFPPIPYLPEAMNPGSHFVAFFEGAGYDTYGTPFIGKTITEDLEITGVWVPYEAAVEKPNGDHIDYYLSFADAASERGGNDNIVRILSAPLFDYTLQKIGDDPAVYEVLKVKRGFYKGTCVYAPDNLPEGYAMRTWTYEDDLGETVTCYTIDGKPTEDAFSLSLDDCIHMNLYLDIKDGENASVTITHNDPDEQNPTPITQTYSGKELASCRDDDDGRYVIKVLAAPAQMRDEITVEVNDGDNSRSFTTSVKDYCEAVIDLYKDSEDTKEQQLVELAKSMLDYGKACSAEFSYNESAFASQDYINTGSVSVDGVIQAEGTTSVLKSYSYIAKSIPSLRIYLNKTEAQCVIDGLVATVTDANGNEREIAPTVVEGTTKVCLDITGILAENFDGINTISYDGATLTINVNQYAKVKGGDFGRSMFNYGVAAKNYFKN